MATGIEQAVLWVRSDTPKKNGLTFPFLKNMDRLFVVDVGSHHFVHVDSPERVAPHVCAFFSMDNVEAGAKSAWRALAKDDFALDYVRPVVSASL